MSEYNLLLFGSCKGAVILWSMNKEVIPFNFKIPATEFTTGCVPR